MRSLPVVAVLLLAAASSADAQESDWPVHSMDRPAPSVVDPGPFPGSQPPPSDATVLFDGTSLDQWRTGPDLTAPARWRIVDGALEVVPGTGAIGTAASFGDVQLHIEWRAPTPATGEGQDRGNSGVFLMGRYEVQVLDSYRSATYADGQAAAIYGQFPPLVNASRPPGEWQSYDIVFRRPRFDGNGRLVEPARMTVIHNGVLVHDAVELQGATRHMERAVYEAHPDRLPLTIQDHGARVQFRNIWVRELEK